MRYVEFKNPEPDPSTSKSGSGTGKDPLAWGSYMRVHLVMTEFLTWIWAPAPSVMDHWDKDALRSYKGMGSRIRPEEGKKGLKIINCTLLTYDEAETPRLTRVGVSWMMRFRLPVKSLVLALKPVNHEWMLIPCKLKIAPVQRVRGHSYLKAGV